MTQCPSCTKTVGGVYQCDKCGDTRCQSILCKGNSDRVKGSGGQGDRCKACGSGHYKKIS